MLLLVLKISIIFTVCLLALQLLKANGSNLKQKIIVATFIFCLLVPFLSQSPFSVNVNSLGSTQANELSILPVQMDNQPIQAGIVTQELISIKAPDNDNTVKVNSENISSATVVWMCLLTVWLLGMLFKLIKYILQMYQLKMIVSRSRSMEFVPIKITQSKCVNYLLSEETNVPFLFVSSKAINIVLPMQSQSWSAQNINNVVAHEMCHYRRRDHWALWLSSLVSILYWFHPLLLRLIKTHKEMIELACDQQLLAEGLNPASYAQTILSIPQNNKQESLVPFMSTKPSLIKKRINDILEHKQSKLGLFKINLLLMTMFVVLIAGCMNNNPLLSSANLVEFISNDLPSLRSGKLDKNHIQMATFYDGVDNQNTFLELELTESDSSQTTWLKLGPLKKFNDQIQTWHYKTVKGGELTGRYKVSNTIADGSVDGVAFGIIYANNDGVTLAHKSVGPLDNDISNILCAWPLDISNNTFNKLAPQLSKEKHETIKRLLCGSQLLKDGVYSLN